MNPADWFALFALIVFVLVALGVAEQHPRVHEWAERTCDRIAGLDR